MPGHRNGFASGYFLALMLYCTMLLAVMSTNDVLRLKTMINMKKVRAVNLMETEALAEVKCRLLNDELEDGTIYTNHCACRVEVEETSVWMYLSGEAEENLLLEIDPETKRIIAMQII